MSSKLIRELEKKIVRLVVNDTWKEDYLLAVICDGEEIVEPTENRKVVFDNLFDVDEGYLFVIDKKMKGSGDYVGWVRFVFGNEGFDVISDYTVNLEELGILTRAQKLADKYA